MKAQKDRRTFKQKKKITHTRVLTWVTNESKVIEKVGYK